LVREEIQPRWAAQLRDPDDSMVREAGDEGGRERSDGPVQDGRV